MVSHVILDLDGTLLNTDGIVNEVLKTMLLKYGKKWDKTGAQRIVGKMPMEAVAAIMEDYELPCKIEEFVSTITPMFNDRWCNIKALPGANRLINHLRSKGVPMALASNSPKSNIEAKISYQHGWKESFAVIIGGDEVQNGKPSPEIFLKAAKMMNTDPLNCLVIEDSLPGVMAGKAAGMEVVAVPSLPKLADKYSSADEVINSLLDLRPEKWGLPPFEDWVENTLPIDPWYIGGPVIKGFAASLSAHPMNHTLGSFHGSSLFSFLSQQSDFSNNTTAERWNPSKLRKVSGVERCYLPKSRHGFGQLPYFAKKCRVHTEEKNCDTGDNILLDVQTLRKFPVEKLYGEVAIVRFDSSILLEQLGINNLDVNKALSTIRYLYGAGAKILLVSNWGQLHDSNLLSTESFADYLSKLLNIEVMPANIASGPMQSNTRERKKSVIILLDDLAKFREELANCSDFSRKLSAGAYIFVNDAFSLSHKILASTVGISRFCDASVAGFHFEEELVQLMNIGGSKFLQKASALHLLASTCDGLIFVGKLAFQIMHALGVTVPSYVLEHDAVGEVLELIQLAQSRKIPIYYPHDLWCANNSNREILEIFPSYGIMTGWMPVDLGPVSLKEISSLLSKCKKVLWIGPAKFDPSVQNTDGECNLTLMLERICKTGCEVTIVGNAACKAMIKHLWPLSPYKMFKKASVVWEFLHGRTLPAVAALDRAYPFHFDWNTIFANPTLPLVVDIGSGNGLFLLNMSKRWKHSNFLGIEINDKLVKQCQQNVLKSNVHNVYFISTNATSSFRSIISGYPGVLVLTSIQCPNPDFNREEHRWRMVQRILVEAIVDLLATNGRVFLQSDMEDVALRMKEQFTICGREKLAIDGGGDEGWLSENPFGVQSDWERHVLDRGGCMYRVMFRKVGDHLDKLVYQPSSACKPVNPIPTTGVDYESQLQFKQLP